MLRSIFNSRAVGAQRRFLSADAKAAPAPVVVKKGGGFFSRVSSFLVGAGFSALASQYFIHQELHAGNEIILKKQKDLENRLSKLEKK